MVKTIYADILFLINFIINYLILFATAKISVLPFSRLRLVLSSSLGALYAVLSFIPILTYLSLFPIKLFIAFLMVFFAFGKQRILKAYLTFFAVSFAFAGVSLLASFIAPRAFSHISGGIYYIHLSLPTLIISSLLAYFLLQLVFLRRGGGNRKICEVRIKNNGSEVALNALVDTGNSLRDPLTNAEVVISDLETLSPLLAEHDAEVLRNYRERGFLLALDKLSEPNRFRLIPYKTVGVSFSLLLAFTPDAILIGDKISNGAVCAISENTISDGSGYNALI